MNITRFQLDTSDFNVDLHLTKPLCFIRGNYADNVLKSMQEAVGGFDKTIVIDHDLIVKTADHTVGAFKRNSYYPRALVDIIEAITAFDSRPIFIYDYFGRLDLATDTLPIIEKLAATGRQVFVAVGSSYPDEKMVHESVEVFDITILEKNNV